MISGSRGLPCPTNRSVPAASRFSPALPESFSGNLTEPRSPAQSDGTSRKASRHLAEAMFVEVSTHCHFESTSLGCSSLRNLPAIALLAPFLLELTTSGAGGIACDAFHHRRLRLLLPLRLPLAPLPAPALPLPPRLLRPPGRDPSAPARRSNAYTCAAAMLPCKGARELSNLLEQRNGERGHGGEETFARNLEMASAETPA